MQRPVFTERQRAARHQALEGAIASPQQTAGEAVEALRCNLACGAPSVHVIIQDLTKR